MVSKCFLCNISRIKKCGSIIILVRTCASIRGEYNIKFNSLIISIVLHVQIRRKRNQLDGWYNVSPAMLSKIWAPNGPNICGIYGKSVDYCVALVPWVEPRHLISLSAFWAFCHTVSLGHPARSHLRTSLRQQPQRMNTFSRILKGKVIGQVATHYCA